MENPPTLLLNIQETHISSEKELPNFVKTYKNLFNFEKTYSTTGDVFSGILMCIRKTEAVISSEVLESGRLLYIKTKNKASDTIKHIFSMYCNPSDPVKQKALIAKLRDKISLNNIHLDSCLVLGDFNFVTSILDRNNKKMNRTDIETSKEWESFEDTFNFQDTFRLTNPANRLYTLTSKANSKFKARLDRIYCTSDICGKIMSTSFIVTCLSDHKIVKVKMATFFDKGRGLWIINNSYMEDTQYHNGIREIAENITFENELFEDYRQFWDFKKQLYINFSQNYGMEKNKAHNFQMYEYKKEYDKLESIHQTKLSPLILERLEFLRKKIDEAQKLKIKGSLLRAKIPNFEVKDPNISFLNRLEKRRGEENTIYYLWDDETNALKNTTNEIKEVVYNFYEKLYTRELEDENHQIEFLDTIDKSLNIPDKNLTNTPLTEVNLFESLKNMNDDKSPGPDGLSKEWYLHFWIFVKGDFINCVREIENVEELSEMQKRGGVKISYKKGDRK